MRQLHDGRREGVDEDGGSVVGVWAVYFDTFLCFQSWVWTTGMRLWDIGGLSSGVFRTGGYVLAPGVKNVIVGGCTDQNDFNRVNLVHGRERE